jgi:hypothetical protein
MSTTDYKRKMEAAIGSPSKKAALGNWDSSIFAKETPPAVVPIKKWIKTLGASEKMLQLLAPSTAGVAYLVEAKKIQILSLPALSQDHKSLIGHAGADFGDNPMPIGLDLLEVSSNIVAILEKPLAEQAKFPFIDKNLNAGPLTLGAGTRNNTTAWDLSNMIPADLKDPQKYPVLVILPKTLPLTYQEPPAGEMDDDDVQRRLQAIDDSALAWAAAMESLIDVNNGVSLAEGKSADEVSNYFPAPEQQDIKSMLGPGQKATSIYCEMKVVLGSDNELIHNAMRKEGDAHMGTYLANNKAAFEAFKSPTKLQPSGGSGFDASALNNLSFTLEDSSKGFSKDTKETHVATLRLLCGSYDATVNNEAWTFPKEEDLHPAAVYLMKSGAKPDTPSSMQRKLAALQRSIVEAYPQTRIGMEANPTTMNRAAWMLFGRGDFRDEPFRTTTDFQDTSTFSVYNVISDASSRSAAKEQADEEKAKAMVGKESTSSTTPTRSTDCHEMLQAVECIANIGLLVIFCASNKDGSTSGAADWPYLAQICENILKAIIGTERSDGNRKGWIQDINESSPWTTMVILQRFANLFVKWAQLATDVQVNQGMVSGNPPSTSNPKLLTIHTTYTKLFSDILGAREDTTNMGGSEPPMYYPAVCPKGYAKVCTARGLPIPGQHGTGHGKPQPGSDHTKDGKTKQKRQKGNGAANAKMGIFLLADPNNKDLSSLKNVPKIKDKQGVVRSFCGHGGIEGCLCSFWGRPKGCQKYHFEEDNDFFGLSTAEQAKLDKFQKENKKLIKLKPKYSIEERKKRAPTDEASGQAETPAAGEGAEGE